MSISLFQCTACTCLRSCHYIVPLPRLPRSFAWHEHASAQMQIASKGEDKVDRAWVGGKEQEQTRLIKEAVAIMELLTAHCDHAYWHASSRAGGHSSRCSLLWCPYRAH
jgi:hypothetical protein